MKQKPEPEIVYDEPADTLYISFAPGERATVLELNDHLLLRVNKRERRAVGITLISFSLLANPGDAADVVFSLTGLDELSPELRQLALEILRAPPVSDYLVLTERAPAGKAVPSTTLNAEKLIARAA